MATVFSRCWDWIRCQTAYEPTASKKRLAVLTFRAFLRDHSINIERWDNAYVVRNEPILPALALQLGQTRPEGKIWQVFFVPGSDSEHVNASAKRVIVLVDDKSGNCCIDLRI